MSEFLAYLAGRHGRRTRLARDLGLSPNAVKAWGATVPCERLIEVADLIGLPPHRLRPDLYQDYVHQPNPEPANEPRRAKVDGIQDGSA